ncbi:MAG: hypothetical protein RML56_07115, partial [Burkholderiales bacterium]|nr:hypothetical protein [Burkholderiales bacterium]
MFAGDFEISTSAGKRRHRQRERRTDEEQRCPGLGRHDHQAGQHRGHQGEHVLRHRAMPSRGRMRVHRQNTSCDRAFAIVSSSPSAVESAAALAGGEEAEDHVRQAGELRRHQHDEIATDPHLGELQHAVPVDVDEPDEVRIHRPPGGEPARTSACLRPTMFEYTSYLASTASVGSPVQQ